MSYSSKMRRRIRLHCIVVALATLLRAVAMTAVDPLRGVDPAKYSIYSSEQFVCTDRSAILQKSAVNDDYCDCVDGSDEPGTSACVTGQFYCQNKGYKPKILPSYFVDDGVCDCCDGSDEKQGYCENQCQKIGKTYREELLRRQEIYASALKEKALRIQNAPSIKEAWENELAKTKDEIETQRMKCHELKEKARILEEEEKKQAATNTTETDTDQENSTETGTSNETETDSENETETEKHVEEDDEVDDENAEDAVHEAYHGKIDPIDDSDDDRDDDYHDEQEDAMDKRLEEQKERQSPTFLHRLKHEFASYFSSFRTKKKIDSDKQEATPEKEWTELSDLRRVQSREERELTEKQRTRESLQRKMDQDYGPSLQFISLADKCFEHEQDTFIYKICPFDKANQKGQGSSVNLGKFSRFGDGSYAWMEFEHGQRCPHGKQRSLKLYFNCGKEDALDFVTEPDMCEYVANFSTPVVCTETELEELTKTTHQLFGTVESPSEFKDEL